MNPEELKAYLEKNWDPEELKAYLEKNWGVGNLDLRSQEDILSIWPKISEFLHKGKGKLISLNLASTKANSEVYFYSIEEILIEFPSLESLSLSDNSICIIPSWLLASTQLQKLDLSKNEIGIDQDFNNVIMQLKSNTTLKTLSLSSSHIKDGGCEAIAQVLSNNSTLQELDISSNFIRSDGAKKIFDALKNNSTLTAIHLNRNLIADGVKEIEEVFNFNHTLKYLNLSSIGLLAEDCIMLAKLLSHNKVLEVLVLSNNAIGENADHIFKALVNNAKLRVLDLDSNGIGDDIENISIALAENRFLQELILSNNNLSTNGIYWIAEGLKSNNSVLKVLNLSYNIFELDTSWYLSDALRVNYTLTSLDISNNYIDSQGLDYLVKEGLKFNTSLRNLDISYTELGRKAFEKLKEILNCPLNSLSLGDRYCEYDDVYMLLVELGSKKSRLTKVYVIDKGFDLDARHFNTQILAGNKILTFLALEGRGKEIDEILDRNQQYVKKFATYLLEKVKKARGDSGVKNDIKDKYVDFNEVKILINLDDFKYLQQCDKELLEKAFDELDYLSDDNDKVLKDHIVYCKRMFLDDRIVMTKLWKNWAPTILNLWNNEQSSFFSAEIMEMIFSFLDPFYNPSIHWTKDGRLEWEEQKFEDVTDEVELGGN